jgi:hypothetical protein
MLVDVNARRRHLREEFRKETFYGQLQHIYLVRFTQPCPRLGLKEPTTTIMAVIRSCKIDPAVRISNLDFHFFSGFGQVDVVDVTCLQCLVARVPVLDTSANGNNLWAIADRSGHLARALYLEDS